MPVITERKRAVEVIDTFREKKASMAIFCTASHWNTEAILLAASRFAEKNGMDCIPLVVAMTFNYKYMPQAEKDRWALTEGLPYLDSVMFDMQKYPYSENIKMTGDYVSIW